MSAAAVAQQIASDGVIAIVRTSSAPLAVAQGTAILEAGLGVVEVSLTTPGALDAIAELAALDLGKVGAGTVLDERAASDAIAAGACFLVSPALDTGVIRTARDADVASYPGCATPTEMLTAMRAGATGVKIFPAHLWSPAALAGLLQAMPDLPCVPTGGVAPDDAGAWIGAGALAVGVGSALTAASDPRPVAEALRTAIAQARPRR